MPSASVTPLLRRVARRLHYWELRHALDARRDALLRHVGRVLWPRLAPAYRPLLGGTTFIAITGSVGKTTTKELVAGVLGRHAATTKTVQGGNQPVDIARAILATRRRHRFAVHEVGVGKRGQDRVIDRSMALIRPTISVVTNVGDDHISAYGSRDAIAREKGKIVAALPAHGIAVLNADDPLVRAMRERCAGRVVTYGRSADADVRAENVRARWPERLSFDVVEGGVRTPIRTQLCGEHWLSATLAAVATARAAGMETSAIAGALADIPPTRHRMEPIERDGVTWICDDAKSPLWTVPSAIAFLRDARASRRILVVGTLSDYAEHRPAYVSVVHQARGIVDHAIFFGQWAWNVERARDGPDDARVQCFNSFEAARQCLDGLLRPGDLVLLKGNEDDRMERFLARGSAGNAPAAPVEANAGGPIARSPPDVAPANDAERTAVVIVGLGNPGERHRGSRHSIGHAVVERLASRHDARWRQAANAEIALVARDRVNLVLVKLGSQMNHSGPALKDLQQALALTPARTILVHDEVKLDVGRVRGRVEGGDGGHLGARSVLAAFEDHRFRRVKVGVGMPPAGRTMTDHVLGGFGDDERASVARGVEAACDQALLFADEIAASATSATARAAE